MDGSLASLREKTSHLGGAIDIISDRWVETITMCALFIAFIDPIYKVTEPLKLLHGVNLNSHP